MAGAFKTLASAFRGGLAPKPARGYIIPRNGHDGDKVMTALKRAFQYFPASLSDNQASNYQTKVIPGLSHPLYQWTSGGARTIAFQAVFTRDRTYNEQEQEELTDSANKRDDLSKLGQRNLNALGEVKNLSEIGSNKDPRNIDIPSAVAWLRSFMLPEYGQDGSGTKSDVPNRPLPPRKMILGLPGVRVNWGVPTLPAHEMNVIMTGCAVVYESFFHDGSPRIAKVNLTFAEIIQIGGRVTVHDADDRRIYGFGGYRLGEEKK